MPRKIPDESQQKKKSTTTKKVTSTTGPEKKTPRKTGLSSTTTKGTIRTKGEPQGYETSNPGPSLPVSEELRERIAQRAYELHQNRGSQHGSDWEDWLQAEREILQRQPPRS